MEREKEIEEAKNQQLAQISSLNEQEGIIIRNSRMKQRFRGKEP